MKENGAARFTLDKETDNAVLLQPRPSVGVTEAKEDMKEDTVDKRSEQENTGADDPLETSERGTDLPVGKRVKNAVKAIDSAKVSVFSYAIMSGQTPAVELVFNLVVKLFRSRTRMVRDSHTNTFSLKLRTLRRLEIPDGATFKGIIPSEILTKFLE